MFLSAIVIHILIYKTIFNNYMVRLWDNMACIARQIVLLVLLGFNSLIKCFLHYLKFLISILFIYLELSFVIGYLRSRSHVIICYLFPL